MEEDASAGAVLTPGSLRNMIASLDEYEIHGTHDGWKPVVKRNEKRRAASLEEDASTHWNQQHRQLSSSSLSSTSTLESPSYFHLSYDHPNIQIHPPAHLFPAPARPHSSANCYFPSTHQVASPLEQEPAYGMRGGGGGVTLGMELGREDIFQWVGEEEEVGILHVDDNF